MGRSTTRRGLAVVLSMALVFLGATSLAGAAVEVGKLLPDDGSSGIEFGFAVAVSGDTMVIGADRGSDGGAAYVFVRSGAKWVQQAKLRPSDGAYDDYFGAAVDISDDTVVVGAYGANEYMGAAYVFARSGRAWSQQQKLTAPDGLHYDGLGIDVAISGDAVIAGAPYQDAEAGAAYIFARSGGAWSLQKKVTASDARAVAHFGASVGLSGNTALVGAYGHANVPGAAYVFVRSGGSWPEQQKLVASDGVNGNYLGLAVDLDAETAIVGAPSADTGRGAAYVFVRSGGSWAQQQKLTATDGASGDSLGGSVGLSGDTAVAGAAYDRDHGDQTGAAYVFDRWGGFWVQDDKLTAVDGAMYDRFADSVAISGDVALVGMPGDDDSGSNSGSAYVFDTLPLYCNGLLATIDGTAGSETLNGTSGRDIIAAGGGDDRVYGGGGNDVICGGPGNDLLVGGPGPDRLIGGSGSDTVAYGMAPSAVTVDLLAGTASGGHGSDTLIGIENATGSPYNDSITGAHGPNRLRGIGGDDTLSGRGAMTSSAAVRGTTS